MPGPPPLPEKRPKAKLAPIDETEFLRIRRHNRYRVIGIIATAPFLVAGSWWLHSNTPRGHFLIWLLVGSPILYAAWTNLFPASKRFNSLNYVKYRKKRELEKFRASRDR